MNLDCETYLSKKTYIVAADSILKPVFKHLSVTNCPALISPHEGNFIITFGSNLFSLEEKGGSPSVR